jgi:hypothetical protein
MTLTILIKNIKQHALLFITAACFMFISIQSGAQEQPPRPIGVSLATGIEFGTFFHGPTGGTGVISPDGTRTSTGDIFLVGFASSPLSFWIDANPGTIISMLPIPTVTLTGSSGGSMTMDINASYPVLPFPAPATTTQLFLGGTLNVSNALANPPGYYSATFFVTFNQE